MTSTLDLAQRLGLHRAGPAAWCASCQDRAGIGALPRGMGAGRTAPAPRPAQDASAKRSARQARARAAALRLWNGSEPAAGGIVAAYLQKRGLPGLAISAALRFRMDCPHPDRSHRPAMVARIDDAEGNIVGIHRTYLRADGTGKAEVEPQKASLGPIKGGAIRLDPVAPELVIAEGIETSASAGRLLGLPAWAGIAAGNLGDALVLPAEVRSIIVAVDRDPAGEAAARKAWRRWRGEGRRVRIALPGRDGADFNDLLTKREATHA